MNKWLVTLNNNRIEFDNYKEALYFFINEISEHFWKYNPINKDLEKTYKFEDNPEEYYLNALCYYLLYNKNLIDVEVLLENKLIYFLSLLSNKKASEINKNASSAINKFYYDYISDEPFILDYDLNINIENLSDEIILEVDDKDANLSLITNIFIVENESKKYYLKSKQIAYGSNNEKKIIKLDITLEKINL